MHICAVPSPSEIDGMVGWAFDLIKGLILPIPTSESSQFVGRIYALCVLGKYQCKRLYQLL